MTQSGTELLTANVAAVGIAPERQEAVVAYLRSLGQEAVNEGIRELVAKSDQEGYNHGHAEYISKALTAAFGGVTVKALDPGRYGYIYEYNESRSRDIAQQLGMTYAASLEFDATTTPPVWAFNDNDAPTPLEEDEEEDSEEEDSEEEDSNDDD